MNTGKYEWKCPREGCKKFIVAYTEGGLRALAEEHIYQHMREDRLASDSPAVKSTVLFRPPDYNTLRLAAADIGFLKTRGVALDDKIVLDPSIKNRPTNESLKQSLWVQILDRAWGNPGEENDRGQSSEQFDEQFDEQSGEQSSK